MTETYANYLDFYETGPYARFIRESRTAGRMPIGMVNAVQPPGDFSDPAFDDLTLIAVKTMAGHATRNFGAGRLRTKYRTGDFELQPPGAATEILVEGDHEIYAFSIPFKRVRELTAERLPGFDGDFGRLHAAPFHDFCLEQLCRQLWQESAAGNPNGSLFADGALVSIVATLLRLRDSASSRTARSGLSDGDCARLKALVDEYIEAHLDADLCVNELAALTTLSEAAFVLALKDATGQSPYQYVLSRRIACAREMLAAGEIALAEVAYACGFASQSHMTDVFRSKLGVTPGRYRKEARG